MEDRGRRRIRRAGLPAGLDRLPLGREGKWNIEAREGKDGRETDLTLSQIDGGEAAEVGFPYFGAQQHDFFPNVAGDAVQFRRVPVRSLKLADGRSVKVATVFDLMAANLGIDRGLGGANVAVDYNDVNVPGTPAWQEQITGVSREKAIQVAREFADNADKTHGRSMIIVGAA